MRRSVVLLKNFFSFPRRIFSHISLFCVIQEAKIDKTAAICTGVRFYRSRIGRYSYIGNSSFVTDTDIGNFTSISSDCYIGGTSHPMDWVSTSPVFHKWSNIMKKNFAFHEFDIFHRTSIGNDVWIGNRAMIKAGVSIGNGAIIGMGAVVTKNVGPYEVWAGNPARFIKKRFDDEIVKELEVLAWWKWTDKAIKDHALYFTSPDDLLSHMEGYKK